MIKILVTEAKGQKGTISVSFQNIPKNMNGNFLTRTISFCIEDESMSNVFRNREHVQTTWTNEGGGGLPK